jgi:hypothetical protein
LWATDTGKVVGRHLQARLAQSTGAIIALVFAAAVLAGSQSGPPEAAEGASLAGPGATRVVHKPGRMVPVPASIPHQAGTRVDSRILPNLRWLAKRFRFYITEGYAGPLRGVGVVGCPGCHVRNSDHHFGLALDIVATDFSGSCGRSWRPVTRLARWAEPRQNITVSPFRWVGYNNDAGHGCGHHLHLSWNHSGGPAFRSPSWVEVFRVKRSAVSGNPASGSPRSRPQRPYNGPTGGLAVTQTGGVASRAGRLAPRLGGVEPEPIR